MAARPPPTTAAPRPAWTLVLPGGAANLGFVRLVVEAGRESNPLSPDELLLLTGVQRERQITAGDAAAMIQRGAADAEHLLMQLGKRGLVTVPGSHRRQGFRLSEAAARRLGARADAQHGRAAPIRHDELVRRYVASHGSISRKEAARALRHLRLAGL